MATLTGNKIKDSYLGLLKSIDNAPFSPRASGTFVQISDGGGNALPLYLSITSIRFYNAYTFPSADGTISGQVLSTDANGTLSWITSSDNQTLEEVLTQGNTTTIAISSSADITTTAQFNGDINGALLQKVKAAEVLSKGDVVYISGGTGDNPQVSKAKADSSTTMPALGIMKEPLALNAEGECITSGELTGVDLTGIATGAELFVSSTTAGELVTTAPTGEANLIQKIGKVIKGGSGGALTVLGAFRTNAVPNLNSAKIFLGNATNQSVSATISGDATISNTGVIALATVPVTKGGTGATTLTGILLGNATSAISGITSGLGSDGHVLTADGNGGYAFEVASGDVSISGTPTTNQVAIWTDGSTIKGMSALEISTDGTITLSQPNSDDPIVVTNSYNIGGGNIANVTGNYNTGFGKENLNVLTSGYFNTALGYRALKSVTTAVSNVAIGHQSLEFLATTTDHDNNTAVGLSSGRRNNGGNNTFIGHQSGQGSITASNNTGTSNTALGYLSLNALTSGNSNTGVGTLALEDNTTGLLNTCLGHSSGKEITTGTKNVILGSFTGNSGGTDIRTSSNNIIISDGGGNIRQFINGSGETFWGNSPKQAYVYVDTTNDIALIGSLGTGMDLGFITGTGTNKLTISSGGEATLTASYSGSTFPFRVGYLDGSSVYTPTFVINDSGNVGIGLSPSRKLDVQIGSGSSNGVGFINGGGKGLEIYTDSNGSNADVYINQTSSDLASLFYQLNGSTKLTISSTGAATHTMTGGSVVLDSNGQIESKQSLDVATAGGRFTGKSNRGILGQIRIEQSTTGADGGYMAFYTCAAGSTTPTTRLTISSGGDVTMSKSEGWRFISSGLNETYISNQSAWNAGNYNSLVFAGRYRSSANDATSLGEVRVIREQTTNDGFYGGEMSFWTRVNGGSITKRLTISSGGITSLLTNQAKTSTSNVEYALLGRTNESTNYSALQLLQKGGASNSVRNWSFQTIEAGVANAGNIVLQPSGGNVGIGSGSNTLVYPLEVHSADNGDGIIYKDTGQSINNWFGAFSGVATIGATTNHPLALYAGGAEHMRISSTGAVTMGSLPSGTGYDLQTDGGNLVFVVSTRKAKKNIEPIDIGLDFILSLEPVKYDLKQNDLSQVGFIAEDMPDERLQVIQPNDNNDLSKGYSPQSVNYKQITAPLVKAIQEQQTIIEDLKSRIEKLEL